MITTIIIVVLAVFAAFLLIFSGRLLKLVGKLQADIVALDEGRDELEDSYNQDRLEYIDDINRLTAQVHVLKGAATEDDEVIKRLFGFVDRHNRFCPSQYEEVIQPDDKVWLTDLFKELYAQDEEDTVEVDPSGG